MSNKITGSVVLSIAATFAVSIGAIGVFAEMQDPTGQNPAPEKQTTTSKRRTTTKKSKQTPTNAEATGDQTPAAQGTTPAAPVEQTPATAVASQASPTEQTDLSGTYSGVFNCDALGLTGDTTLTITGNQFTTADGKSGRIVASTTRGYTAVALQLGDTATSPSTAAAITSTPATSSPVAAPTIVSLRGRKSGNRLTLSSVSGGQPCSFRTGSKVASRRTQRSTQAPAATGAEVSSPAEAGPAPADMTKPTTPTRKYNRRSTTRTTAPAEAPPVTVTPMETVPKQDPSPIPPSPSPSPTPSSSPTPSGSPSASPSPNPSPEASPNPSPSPSPSPASKRPQN